MTASSVSGAKLGRNDQCPRCFEKVKRCVCKKEPWRFLAPWFLGLAIAVGMLFVFSVFSSRETTDKDSFSTDEEVQAYLNLPSRASEEWWLTEIPQGEAATEKLHARLAMARDSILAVLAAHRDVSPLAREIASTFRAIHLTTFSGGASILLQQKDSFPPQGSIEICFVPKSEAMRSEHVAFVYYRHDWRALMLFGLPFPETLFNALLLHELGHAFLHKQRGYQGNANNSDADVDEEMEMHALEASVLDSAVHGRYYAAIDAYIDQKPREECEATIGRIGRNDLVAFDEIIGTKNCSLRIAQVTSAVHCTSIALRSIERFSESAARFEARRRFYRWFRDQFTAQKRR